MKFTYNWLRRHLNTQATPKEIADKLTLIGLEIENINDKRSILNDFIIAKIIDVKKHPNADNLKLLMVDNGKECLQVVCGAPNARVGIYGVLALPGVIIPSTKEKLKISKIRGIESRGMMCAEDELCLSDLHDSIIELPNNVLSGVRPGDSAISVLEKIYNIDTVFDCEVTSNRSDYLGVNGIAFDCASVNMGDFLEEKIEEVNPEIKNPINIKNNIDLSKVFAGVYIKDINIVESPKWLKDLLLNVGISPINAIVDISNFICLDMNRPLHIFDADKIIDNTLTVRKSQNNEEIYALNDKLYKLSDSDIVVCSGANAKSIESIAGIIGAKRSCVTNSTKNIFIESALFDNLSIRKTSSRLGIITDSKYRFERFVSPITVISGLHKAIKLIKEICGGKVSEIVLSGVIEDNKKVINYPLKHIKNHIGVDISNEKIIEILNNLGFSVTRNSDDCLNLITPANRGDLNNKYDVTEEIIRIYGYDKIPVSSVKKNDLINQTLSNFQKAISLSKKSLCSLGMMEVYTLMFGNYKKQIPFISNDKEIVKLLNPISSELDSMRSSLLPNLLTVVSNNIIYDNNDLSIFECGSVFDGYNTGEEHLNIAGIRYGFTNKKHWTKRERKYDVFDVKEDLFSVLNAVNIDISKIKIRSDIDFPIYLNPFKSGAVFYKNKLIAYFGEIHPIILKDYAIKNMSVFCFEIDFSKLPSVEYNKFSTKGSFVVNPLQKVIRDLSFVIDKKIKSSDLINCIKEIKSSDIKDVYIFDVYENDKYFGNDKKSIGLTLYLQPNEETLTDYEINKIIDEVINKINKNFSGILLKNFIKS